MKKILILCLLYYCLSSLDVLKEINKLKEEHKEFNKRYPDIKTPIKNEKIVENKQKAKDLTPEDRLIIYKKFKNAPKFYDLVVDTMKIYKPSILISYSENYDIVIYLIDMINKGTISYKDFGRFSKLVVRTIRKHHKKSSGVKEYSKDKIKSFKNLLKYLNEYFIKIK